jgi:hypothetical protein
MVTEMGRATLQYVLDRHGAAPDLIRPDAKLIVRQSTAKQE